MILIEVVRVKLHVIAVVVDDDNNVNISVAFTKRAAHRKLLQALEGKKEWRDFKPHGVALVAPPKVSDN